MTALFWLGACALVALAWALLLPALRRPAFASANAPGAPAPVVQSGATADSSLPASSPLDLLKEQLAALDAEFEAGQLDAAEHRTARTEVERRVLDEAAAAAPLARATRTRRAATPRATLAILGAGVPLLAFGLYVALGNRDALAPPSEPAAGAAAAGVSPDALQAMLAQIDQQLSSKTPQPDDVKGWTLLGRSYAALRQFAPARRAYEHAIGLAPRDAQLLADQADVIAMLQGERTAGEPQQLVDRALQIDPHNVKALALAGSGDFERGDFARALARWTEARASAEPGSDFALGLERSIADARSALGTAVDAAPGNGGRALAGVDPSAAAPVVPRAESAAPAAAWTGAAEPSGPMSGRPTTVAGAAATEAGSAPVLPSTTTATAMAPTGTTSAGATSNAAAAAASRLAGRVALAPALAARVAPDDTVFVFARAAQGPRMPLAVQRRRVADLPFDFQLDDAMAMSPEMKLSKFGQVVVVARISKSGSAMPTSGDLQGQSDTVTPGTAGIGLTIDSVQP